MSLALLSTDCTEQPRVAEAELVNRARQDRQAFAELYRRQYSTVAGYICRRLGDGHAAEDLIAETFMAALTALPGYRQRGLPLRAWLLRIASHRISHWLRRERFRRTLELVEDPPGRTVSDEDGRMARLREEMLTLPDKYQTVLALHYLEGLPLQELALVLDCRLGTIKSRLSRARKLLRDRIERRSE